MGGRWGCERRVSGIPASWGGRGRGRQRAPEGWAGGLCQPLSHRETSERGLDNLVGRGPQATIPPEPAWNWSHRAGDTATERGHSLREGTRSQRGDTASERGHGLREGHCHRERTWLWRGDTALEREHGLREVHNLREGHSLREGTLPQRGTRPQRGIWSWEACSALSLRGCSQGLDAAPPTPTHSFATDEESRSRPP